MDWCFIFSYSSAGFSPRCGVRRTTSHEVTRAATSMASDAAALLRRDGLITIVELYQVHLRLTNYRSMMKRWFFRRFAAE